MIKLDPFDEPQYRSWRGRLRFRYQAWRMSLQSEGARYASTKDVSPGFFLLALVLSNFGHPFFDGVVIGEVYKRAAGGRRVEV